MLLRSTFLLLGALCLSACAGPTAGVGQARLKGRFHAPSHSSANISSSDEIRFLEILCQSHPSAIGLPALPAKRTSCILLSTSDEMVVRETQEGSWFVWNAEIEVFVVPKELHAELRSILERLACPAGG